MADPDSIMVRRLEGEGKSILMQRIMEHLQAELDAHMAEMDRQIVERLEQILSDAHTHRPYVGPGPVGMGKSMRARRLSALFASSADDAFEDQWPPCGRLVYYDEVRPDFADDDGARIEYLKSLVEEEPVPQPPRRCPRPQRLERKGRDAERRAQNGRNRRQQPARVFAR